MPDGINRNPFTISNQMTLSEVLLRISLGAGLTPQRRRNLCSALRGVGKLMNRDLSYLPAHPGFYRPMFKGLHPEHCGLTKSRIANIKSDVLFALRHTGCIHQGHTYMAPLTPAWQALWDKAACAGRSRVYVSRLMHYCSAQDIAPGDVDDGVSEQLKGALVEESFVGNPVKTHKDILRIWNKLVELVPDWPQVRLTISNDRDDYSIPLEQFPKPFRDEVDALAILIKTLAKYWIKVDKEHLDALKTLCSKVDPNINPHFPSELNIRCPEMEIML